MQIQTKKKNRKKTQIDHSLILFVWDHRKLTNKMAGGDQVDTRSSKEERERMDLNKRGGWR